ncbi:hypothetical protein QTV44_002474 [Vibrio vulnificus]|nr:hypothetical protein [Vibrio vulnificus]
MIKPPRPETQTLIFIGTANWDLYLDNDGYVWSVPKPTACPSCKTSYFGDKHHLRKLMQSGNDLGTITEHGREYLSGLYTQLMDGWHWLRFA